MSDRDPPDPVDTAYVEAEALLSDEADRAARRARVLAAVAQEAGASPPGEAAQRRPSPWRRGGWLAAASVAVFCAFLAARIYRPVGEPPPAPPATPARLAPPPSSNAASPPPVASPGRLPPAAVAAGARPAPTPRADARPAETVQAAKAGPVREMAPAPPPAPPPPPPPPLTVPSPPALVVPSPPASQDVVVTASRLARRSPAEAVTAVGAPAGALPADEAAARLRAAALAGRAAEIETLLAQGVPVDAPDAGGSTALMASIRAGRAAAAALLRRHGASLDLRNRAGVSARDLAISRHDPAMAQALGLPQSDDGAAPPDSGSR